MADLLNAVNALYLYHNEEYNEVFLPKGYYKPGFIVALTAFLYVHKVEERHFDSDPDVASYLRTMAFSKALWKIEDSINRVNLGRNYSVITPLHSAEIVDDATSSINSCIRGMSNGVVSKGMSDLFHVVGELHDNVWSHGLSSGFSMAQRQKVPNTGGDDYYFEFALADSGLGFLNEMKNSKMDVKTHKEAIQWCVQKGNSTKHGDNIDEWAQSVPADLIGANPLGTSKNVRFDGNHHQGLGLAHLVALVKKYRGKLLLVTGDICFNVDSNGKEQFLDIQKEWKGVAISCRFKESKLSEDLSGSVDAELISIMEKLKGDANGNN